MKRLSVWRAALTRRLQQLQAQRHARHSAVYRRPLLTRAEILDLLQDQGQGVNAADQRPETTHQRLGDVRSVFRGHGLDYEESRPYQPGDELRAMNWRLTARILTPHVKVFREERRPPLFVAVDRRASMWFGTRTRLKAAQAARVAAVAAFTAARRNTSIGGVLIDTALHWIAESNGDQGAFALIDAIIRPAAFPLKRDTQELGIGEVLRLLDATLPKGADIVLISDFHDLQSRHRPLLLSLASDHQVRAVEIFDPAEAALPRAGRLRLVGPAASGSPNGDLGEDISVDTDHSGIRRGYQEAAQRRAAAVQQLLTAAGVERHRRVSTRQQAIAAQVLD